MTAFVLLYGDYPDLARRFFERWKRYSAGVPLRVGMNACGPSTAEWVDRAVALDPRIRVLRSERNLGKAPMMRRLFREWPIDTEWVVWFDDDSFPFRADWVSSLEIAIAAQPEAAMLGIPAEMDADERLIGLVREAAWYRGLPMLDRDSSGKSARVEFVLGGFWAMRSEWIERLDWPDPRLEHFAEDCLLGEALRQNGGRIGRFRSGVRIDTAPRRVPQEVRDRWESGHRTATPNKG